MCSKGFDPSLARNCPLLRWSPTCRIGQLGLVLVLTNRTREAPWCPWSDSPCLLNVQSLNQVDDRMTWGDTPLNQNRWSLLGPPNSVFLRNQWSVAVRWMPIIRSPTRPSASCSADWKRTRDPLRSAQRQSPVPCRGSWRVHVENQGIPGERVGKKTVNVHFCLSKYNLCP